MSRVLVTYADVLGDVMAAAEGTSEHNARGMAWRDLLKTVGSATAPAHGMVIRQLPELADVRYVVGRGTGQSRVEVCSYGRLATARAALRALDGQTDHHYTVKVDVQVVGCPDCGRRIGTGWARPYCVHCAQRRTTAAATGQAKERLS